jgi:o-succinylbenzoate---CoA ligase
MDHAPALNLNSPAFEQLVSQVAAKLRSVRPGERVAFVAKPHAHTVALFFALWRLGAVACPLTFRLPSIAPALEELDAHHLVEIEDFSYRTLPASTPPSDGLATLLFTSGSSGKPKIAAHTLEQHLANARSSNSLIQLTPQDRWALTLPLFHVGGIAILLRCHLAGCSIAFDKESATHLSLVPTQLYRLLSSEKIEPFKALLIGGAPLSATLLKRAKELPLITSYGMTEMSSQIASDQAPLAIGELVTSGRPLQHTEIKLTPEGEICARGPALFQGYWDKKQGIHLPLDNEGFFPTKDCGQWTADGRLLITGRKDNLFISGGENIQPEEIESALLALPQIVEALVVPLDDEEFGARPAAFISCEGESPSPELIQEKLRAHLPKYKIPVRILPFPPTNGMKRERRSLTQLANKLN